MGTGDGDFNDTPSSSHNIAAQLLSRNDATSGRRATDRRRLRHNADSGAQSSSSRTQQHARTAQTTGCPAGGDTIVTRAARTDATLEVRSGTAASVFSPSSHRACSVSSAVVDGRLFAAVRDGCCSGSSERRNRWTDGRAAAATAEGRGQREPVRAGIAFG